MGTELEANVHWWSVCTALPVAAVERVMGPLGDPEGPGGRGQPFRRVHESGTVVYCGSSDPAQPIVLDASGTVCETWAYDLVKWAVDLKAWATRVDLEVDKEPAALARRRLLQLRRAFHAGLCQTNMRQGPEGSMEFHQNAAGATVVFGGVTSQLRLRAYDERGPLRLEFQWRPERKMGELLPELLLRHGAAKLWRSLASGIVFPHPWYQELLEGEVLSWDGLPRLNALLAEAIEQIVEQYGLSLGAFEALGYTLQDLTRWPSRLRGSQAAKLLGWANEGERAGYNGQKLRDEVNKRCNSKSRHRRP